MVERQGLVLFADLGDSSVRADRALINGSMEANGHLNLQGVAMTSPESSYLYLGTGGGDAAILEYEWHETRRITRRFGLPGFADPSSKEGIQSIKSLTWVPAEDSAHGGYFHVGSANEGKVFVYELPLLEDTGPEAPAQLISSWSPLPGSRHLGGLASSGGVLFASFEERGASHVLVYEALANGLHGKLREQYEVDVAGAEGLTARRKGPASDAAWEVIFIGGAKRAVYAYLFRFVTGFELHGTCASLIEESSTRSAAQSRRPIRRSLHGTLWLSLAGLVHWCL